jgi:hypothetical protein
MPNPYKYAFSNDGLGQKMNIQMGSHAARYQRHKPTRLFGLTRN